MHTIEKKLLDCVIDILKTGVDEIKDEHMDDAQKAVIAAMAAALEENKDDEEVSDYFWNATKPILKELFRQEDEALVK